jgi:predicted HD superfamily hydrolase involved in NAD metabolism
MTIDQMTAKLKSSLLEKRFIHSLGVMKCAEKLAELYGADAHKAAVAGLLHDCAKNYSKDDMFSLCEEYGIELDDVMRKSTGLIHGLLGAEVAKREYGIDDEEIYDAIYYHTMGKPDMSLLTKIIYIADGIEENRHYDGVDRIRSLAEEDLDKALILQIDYTIKSVISKGGLLHTNTIDTRNWYLSKQHSERL